MEKIYKTLQNISKKINQIPKSNLINCGGCCWFSSLIAKELDKINVSYNVVILHDTDESEEYFEDITNIISNNSNIDAVYHVMLKINNYYYDSLGMNRRIPSIYNDRVSESQHKLNGEILQVWYEMASWNKTFHYITDENINKIQNIIKDEFKSSF